MVVDGKPKILITPPPRYIVSAQLVLSLFESVHNGEYDGDIRISVSLSCELWSFYNYITRHNFLYTRSVIFCTVWHMYTYITHYAHRYPLRQGLTLASQDPIKDWSVGPKIPWKLFPPYHHFYCNHAPINIEPWTWFTPGCLTLKIRNGWVKYLFWWYAWNNGLSVLSVCSPSDCVRTVLCKRVCIIIYNVHIHEEVEIGK